MAIIGWIIFGLIVGIVAKFLMPGRDPGGELRLAAVPQGTHCAFQIAGVTVLSKLSFSLQMRDLHFDADDHLQHLIQVVSGCVAHLPGMRFGSFMPSREASHHASNEPLVVDDSQLAVRVDDLVVPRGYVTVSFVLARVPAR